MFEGKHPWRFICTSHWTLF